eukprot:scaffold16706_cov78-Skeletonema_dohrnii-CCMP3373.AAC.2
MKQDKPRRISKLAPNESGGQEDNVGSAEECEEEAATVAVAVAVAVAESSTATQPQLITDYTNIVQVQGTKESTRKSLPDDNHGE